MTVALASGSRLGPYEILDLVGSSETGDVYKATDTRLNRTVAVKVLPPHFAGNAEMRERFEREARTIASLNHPNIRTLHDIGQEEGHSFLVTEFLEGETLAERLNRGALPLHEALKMAAEIADALDKAHAQGVVHRDLKPSNIMLTASGAKLLDFGLAKWSAPAEASVSASMAPTRMEPTARTAISGPVDYMSPEQLEGKDADARADIFALGVIFYEAVTGRKAFEGKTRTILIASILTGDPDPMPEAPSALDHTIRRCLAKDPEARWQTAHDLAVQIQWIAGGGEAAVPAALAARQRKRERLMLVAVGALVLFAVILATSAIRYFRAAEAEPFAFRVPIANVSQQDIAISPNGRMVVVAVRPEGLYVRPVDGLASRRLTGTEDASLPFWSPDSGWIGFVSGGKLKKVEVGGGPVADITAAADFAGGAWSSEGEGLGTILFGSSKGLFRVSAEGGPATALTTVAPPETGHFWPEFLPDGVNYIYLAWSGDGTNRALFSGALDSEDKPAKVMPAESNAAYAPPGYLLFHREATVFAQPFSAKSLKTTGDAVRVAGGVSFNASNGRGDFDVSQEGTLLYFQGQGAASAAFGGRGGTNTNAQLAWVSPAGGVVAAGAAGSYGDFDLSRDGKLIAVTRQEDGAAGADIWIIDWQRAGVANPLTFDPADDINPVFSPDGSQVAFTSYRKGNADIYVRNINGIAGSETPLVETPTNEFVEAWSRDGHIAYIVEHDNIQDISVKPVSGEGKPVPLVTGPFRKDEPQFSPDGKWLAYTAETGGMFQVWVTPFPKGDQFFQISKEGGGQPRWHPETKELYYRDPNSGVIMAVRFAGKADGTIDAGSPEIRYAGTRVNNNATTNPVRHQLSVHPDGRQFLLRVVTQAVTNQSTGERTAVPQILAFTRDSARGFFGRGRGGNRGALATGLTVVQRWTSGMGRGAE
jgi:Tol biopolymer transport system component